MGQFTLEGRRDEGTAPFEQDNSKRDLTARTSVAKIIYFSYYKQNFGVASNVRAPFDPFRKNSIKAHVDGGPGDFTLNIPGTIEDGIDSIQVVKNLRSPSGSFSISLFPNKNWKKVLRPGDWILIYLHANPGRVSDLVTDTEDCVMMGNIDRVSKVKEKDEETDKVMVRYKVSGRNFGKVFEKTEIWFDPYTNQSDTVDITLQSAGLPLTGSPDEITTSLLDIFLGEGGRTADGSTTKPLNQWTIPLQLSSFLGGSSNKFFDSLDLDGIESGLPGYKDRQMIGAGKGGNLWEAIKRASNSVVNEVFVEEVRQDDYTVKPTIKLRPRPYNTIFFRSQFGFETRLRSKLNGKFQTLQDLAKEDFVELASSEVLYEDLGFDEHSRFNMFWLEPRGYASELQSIYSNINKNKGVGLPMVVRESIERYGLRRFDQTLDFAHTSRTDSKDANAEFDLFGAFLVQLYDFYYANHLYEQGTLETTGVIEAELGTALVVKDEADGSNDKVYYVEGYEHIFRYPNTWTTKFTLTRGQFLNGNDVFIDAIGIGDFGRDDSDIDENYLIKTDIER